MKRWLPALALGLAIPLTADAQITRTWDGGGGADNSWTNQSNWSDDFAPLGTFNEVGLIDSGATALINNDLIVLGDGGYPGGLTVSNNSTLQINSGGVFNVNTAGPNVDGSVQFTSGGKLIINGSSASFTANSLSFGGGGILNPNITGSFQSAAVVNGTLAADGGVLRPTFGFVPSPQSWVVADATDITGDFTLDSSAATLGPGGTLRASVQAGGLGEQLVLTYQQVLALTVNTDTGVISMSSPSGSSVQVTGYSISSPGGQLSAGGWTPLQTSLGGGWDVVGTSTSNRLEELAGPIPPTNTTQDKVTVNSTARSLGAAFASQPFGVVPDANMTFDYVTASGELVQGIVQFTGVNAVNNLLATVGTDGYVELKNSSTSPVQLRGYTLYSPGGALQEANWTSLDSQGVAGVDEALGGPTANYLSELVPDVDHPLELAPGQSYNLGHIFNTASDQDLELQFLIATGSVEGDFNGDGTVDLADYTVWRDNLGAPNEDALNGNGNGGGVDASDYLLWKNNFGASGGGAGSMVLDGTVLYSSSPLAPVLGITSAAVPEPTSLCLIVGLLAAAGARRRLS